VRTGVKTHSSSAEHCTVIYGTRTGLALLTSLLISVSIKATVAQIQKEPTGKVFVDVAMRG
jgi:hypothetical protein